MALTYPTDASTIRAIFFHEWVLLCSKSQPDQLRWHACHYGNCSMLGYCETSTRQFAALKRAQSNS
jgi:hypothetical protein